MAENIGNGSKLGYSSASPTSWNVIGNIIDMPTLEEVRAEIDRSVHGEDRKRTMPGKITVSSMALVLLADVDETSAQGAVQLALRDLFRNATTVWWRAEIPTTPAATVFKAFELQAYISQWSVEPPQEDRQVVNITLAFNGTSFAEYAAGATGM